jgi:hypothetical protein
MSEKYLPQNLSEYHGLAGLCIGLMDPGKMPLISSLVNRPLNAGGRRFDAKNLDFPTARRRASRVVPARRTKMPQI